MQKSKRNSAKPKRLPILVREVEEKPPMFQSSICIGRRFRFQATAAGTTPLSVKSFGDLLCAAATATSAFQLAEVVKIRSIEMWGNPSSTLVPVTVSCSFDGQVAGYVGKSQIKSDTSIGSTRPAHILISPSRDTLASKWQAASQNVQICSLSYPAGAIIDVNYSIVLRDDATAVAVSGAVVGATVGALYLRSLDSVTASNLPPTSYSTI